MYQAIEVAKSKGLMDSIRRRKRPKVREKKLAQFLIIYQ